MPRGCSDSDSEEERHDRFKSERNKTTVPSLRPNIPSSLDTYLGRARSPLRPDNFKVSRHRSRYSEERRRVHSPPRRVHSRDKKSSRESEKRSSSQEFKEKPRRKRSHERSREECDLKKRSKELDDKHAEHDRKDSREREHKHRTHKDRKRSSREKDRKVECIRRRKSRDEAVDSQSSSKHSSQDKSSSEKSRDSDSSVCIKSDDENGAVSDVESQPLPRYYELVDESAIDSDQKNHSDDKNSKKHKKTRDRSENHHDNKKRKKEKKHKRKHEKRKSEGDSDSKIVEDNVTNEPAQLSTVSSSVEQSNETDNIIKLDDVEEEEENKENEVAKDECKTLKRSSSEQEEGEISGSESEQYFGPALPPGKNAERTFGPMLPSDVDHYGPALPPSLPATEEKEEDNEPEGDVIGPLPAGIESSAQSALDARASLIKYQMENKTGEDGAPKREAWMTELPDAKRAVLGLGPRKFRANAGPDMTDRSSWTDTPEDKAKKQLAVETEDPPDLDSKKLEIIERNKEMELLAKKSEKKSKSLLHMHQKELKKKKKKKDKDKTPERRPFSRELDLQTNRFDEAQKRSIIKKAQLLDSRFSSGESKYL